MACLQGKVASAFTSVGGHGRGYGGHEAILQGFHSCFLQHGMVCLFPLTYRHLATSMSCAVSESTWTGSVEPDCRR